MARLTLAPRVAMDLPGEVQTLGEVHTLVFTSKEQLSRAFDRLMSSAQLEDCVVETDQVRLRFLAPSQAAVALIERIYLEGGLRWYSRHRIAR